MTDFLFAKPSIVAGIASCIDLFAVYNLYNESSNELIADKRALLADAMAIRNDFSVACTEVLNEP